MLWSDFKADVKKHLTVDANRLGSADFILKQTRAAVSDVLEKTPFYRLGYTRELRVGYGMTTEDSASLADLERTADIRDARAILATVPDGAIVVVAAAIGVSNIAVSDFYPGQTVDGRTLALGDLVLRVGTGRTDPWIIDGDGHYRPNGDGDGIWQVTINGGILPDDWTIETALANVFAFVPVGTAYKGKLYGLALTINTDNGEAYVTATEDTETLTYERFECTNKVPWAKRNSLVHGSTCSFFENPIVAISPHGGELYIYPAFPDEGELDDTNRSYSLEITYDSDEPPTADTEDTPYDERMVACVGDWVKAKCALHFEKNPQMHASLMLDYQHKLRRLYLRGQQRGHMAGE